MSAELEAWLEGQTRRERRVVRLEDALLADRYGPYFFYRLRFFLARTAIATVLHAIRILLLLSAFAIDDFLVLVVLAALAALTADSWWGALESLRARIRHLQRIGARYRAPEEIAPWLRLSAWLCGVGLLGAFVALLGGVAVNGALSPMLAMVVAIMVGASVNLVTRAYHSGAYAVRRVYRPLPSLIAADVVGLGSLLLLWPVLGIWAFPVAEFAVAAVLTGVSLWFTTRTYRSLAFPTLPALLGSGRSLPRRRELRDAVAPAISFGAVGLETVVLVAVLMAGDSEASAVLVTLLAALSPVIRAGFEWARLLYFDLARLEVPLLAGLRRRFEHEVAWLSVIIGGVTWGVAAIVALVVLGIRDVALLLALLPFFVARSAAAAAQMRAFTARAHLRLTLSGLAAAAGFVLVMLAVDGPAQRIIGLTVAVALPAIALLVLPSRDIDSDRVLPLTEWLSRLRGVEGAVTLYRVSFDRRDAARGVTPDERRRGAWRRRAVARRLAVDTARAGGLTTWLSPHVLIWFEPRSGSGTEHDVAARAARVLGGLHIAAPIAVQHETGRVAAEAVATHGSPVVAEDKAALMETFRLRVPSGLVHDVADPGASPLETLPSPERSAVLRAALRFIAGARPTRSSLPYEVSAAADADGLQLIFLTPRDTPRATRRDWAHLAAAWNRRVAVTGDVPVGRAAVPGG